MRDRVHDLAARGFSSAAAAYARGRPGYPPAAVDRIVERFAVGAQDTLLDVAAGTGKLTALLVSTGARVIAVEPLEEMRLLLAALVPQADVRDGTAEDLPVADASVRVVTVAQAFHWFDHAAALTAFARVLEPGGGLAAIWNRRDEDVDWVAELSAIIDPYESTAPRQRDSSWRSAVEDAPGYGPLQLDRFTHVHTTDLDAAVDKFASVSFIATLPDGERAEVLGRIRAVCAAAAEGDGLVRMPYNTALYTCKRRA